MHDLNAQQPKQTPQHLLDVTGAALMDGEFSKFAPVFHLPQPIATVVGATLMETRDDLRAVFERVRAHYLSLGVVSLDRKVDCAIHDGPDRIHYSHISRLVGADGALVQPAYPCLSCTDRIDGDWKVTRTQYALRNTAAHDEALIGQAGQEKTTEIQNDPATATFQALLDSVTTAYLKDDFELLCSLIQLPLFVQKSMGTMVFPDRDALLQDFKRYQTEFKVHRISDIVRRVLRVEQVGERRMHGTYRTHVLRGSDLVIPGYTSALTLEQGEDLQWRATSIMHPMGHLTMDRIFSGDFE